MSDIGFVALSLALSSSSYSVAALALGIRKNESRLLTSGKRAIYASATLVTVAMLALTYALLTRDFQIAYVFSHSSRDLPLAYTLSPLWAGREGSLLLVAWVLCLYAVAAAFSRRHERVLQPYSLVVIACVLAFFLGLLVLVEDPFVRLDFVPGDGVGMNPLLQNWSMIWQTPLVYLGYVGFTVPFALTMAVLLSGRMEEPYVPLVRRWTLFPWLCLGMGTLLRARGAYFELGEARYWAWDPVENASLLAWLAATAMVHSLMFRAHGIRVSHIFLAMATFALCITGAFITPKGVIDGVDGLAGSTISPHLLGFLALVVAGSALLVFRRRKTLARNGEGGPLFSRRTALLVAIILLLAGALTILFGTLSTLSSRSVDMAVTPDYLNVTSLAVFGPLILLMGICPFARWEGSSFRELARGLLAPVIAAVFTAGILFALGRRDVLGLVSLPVCSLVLVGTVMQFFRGPTGDQEHARGSRLRPASSLAHVGIALIAVGVIGSIAYKQEGELTLEPGGSATFGEYTLRYDEFSFRPVGGADSATVSLTVLQGNSEVAVLRPETQFRHVSQQLVSEAAVRSTLKDDLYVSLMDWDGGGGRVILQGAVIPLVNWIWIGGIVLLLGGAAALAVSERRAGVDQQIERAINRLRREGSSPVQEGRA